jgi:hypothetical protein
VSDRFAWDPLAIRDTLAGLGYDVDLTEAWAGGIVRARRDRGERACLLAIDAGGRIRADLTATLDESARRAEAHGVALRIVAATERRVTVTGTVPDVPALAAVAARLDALAAPDLPPGVPPPIPGGTPAW